MKLVNFFCFQSDSLFSIKETLDAVFFNLRPLRGVWNKEEEKIKLDEWESNPYTPLSIEKEICFLRQSKQSMYHDNAKVWFRLRESLFFFSVTPSSYSLDIIYSNPNIRSSICVKIFRSIRFWHPKTFLYKIHYVRYTSLHFSKKERKKRLLQRCYHFTAVSSALRRIFQRVILHTSVHF